MAITITLSTVPGTLNHEDYGTSKTISLFGPSLGTETLAALTTVADIKAAVARFGARIRAEHPEESFWVSVRLAKGNRKPNGYDAISRGNGLGQEDFMRVTDRRTTPPAPPKPAGTLLEQAGA